MADSVKYIVKSDCLVFGKYRAEGEEFMAPAWKEAYTWPMPDFIEVVGEAIEAPKAKPPKAMKAPATAADLG